VSMQPSLRSMAVWALGRIASKITFARAGKVLMQAL
jgi:hypothetical protein